MTDYRNIYPINTFAGTTQDELVRLMELAHNSGREEALRPLYDALCNKGINPKYHDQVKERFMFDLQAHWPSLHRALRHIELKKEEVLIKKK